MKKENTISEEMQEMSKFLRDFAVVLYSYQEDLKVQKFTDKQAFSLIRDFQKETITKQE